MQLVHWKRHLAKGVSGGCARLCLPGGEGTCLSVTLMCHMVSSVAPISLVVLRGQWDDTQARSTGLEKAPSLEFSLLSSSPQALPSFCPPSPQLSRAWPFAALLAPGSSWCLGISKAPGETPPEPRGGVQGQPASCQEAAVRSSGPGTLLCEFP